MEVSSRVIGFGILISFTLDLSACGERNLMSERTRKVAPQGPQDVGIVIQGANPGEIETILSQHDTAQVRVLNPEHGMYEIFHVQESDVQSASKGQVSRNAFFDLNSRWNRPTDSVQNFSSSVPEGFKIGKLKPCQAPNLPDSRPQAQILDSDTRLRDGTIEIGKDVWIRGAGGVRQTVVLISPNASLLPSQTVLDGSEHHLKPDALGLYEIILIIQDEKDVCAMDRLRFLVTANRPYIKPSNRSETVDLTQFAQLRQVDAGEAWKASEGKGVVIAVIDTGVNYNHPFLADNIRTNEKEIRDNQIDDDQNGFVDDYLGFDFTNSDPFPYDDDGHGTHVAGLAASRQFGLAPEASLIAIKAMSSKGGDIGTVAAAIRYAVDRQARIINLSLGTSAAGPHPALVSAISYAAKKGVLVVVAAGNGDPNTGLGFNIDEIPVYPASLNLPNLITVGAFDEENILSVYSNFGAKSVTVLAPGGLGEKAPLLSTAFENPRHISLIGMAGTSMSAPIVTGIAAQVWGLAPALSFDQVRNILLSSGPSFPELKPISESGRHINAKNALEITKARNAQL